MDDVSHIAQILVKKFDGKVMGSDDLNHETIMKELVSNSDIKVNNPNSPIEIAVDCIEKQKSKELKIDLWSNSIFKHINSLESNNVGEVGESLLESLCRSTGIGSEIDGTKTKQKGGGSGDGLIKGKNIEIKTARVGCNNKSFQHELGEYPWKSDYMVFIDFSPDSIYLTIFPNWTEGFYKESGSDKSKKCGPYFPTRTITQRKGEFNFKLDTTMVINEGNVKKDITLKVTNDTNFENVKEYINRVIT